MPMPRTTLAVLSCCVMAALWPALAGWLIYDRAAILDGEIWRLLTGNLVHFSLTHLLLDLLAFGLAGWLVEQRHYPGLLPLYLGMPAAIGLTLLAGYPGMAKFGGMSGMACGVMTFAALHGLHEQRRWRATCVIILALLTVKLAFDMSGNMTLMLMQPAGTLVAAPASHAAGSLFAILLYSWQRIRRPGSHPVLQ